METVMIIILILMFIAIYMISFFLILLFKNHSRLFDYPKPTKNYSVSIIIPAFNEEKSIGETIEHVIGINYPKKFFEVIVINDGSTDNTLKILREYSKKYPQLKIIDKKNTGKADSLNQGIKIARGELVGVVDSDSFPSKESVNRMVGFFDNPKMAAVTSFVNIRNKDATYITKIQSLEYMFLGWTRKLLDFVDSVYVTNGPLSLYRKKYVQEVGGFDPKSITEDIDITWNLLSHGYKTSMSLAANVSTIAPSKFKPWLRQRERWGIGGFQVIAKYKNFFFRRGLFGSFVIPFVILSILLAIFSILFSFYLIMNNLLSRFFVTTYSLYSDASIFHFQDFNFYPSVVLFFLAILFTYSLIYYNYILHKTKYEEKINARRFFNLVFYALVYLTLYGIVWFPSLYRYLKKDFKW